MEIVLLQSAQADLLEIYVSYGETSYSTVDRALESIRLMPESAPIYHEPFRRKYVLGTPYGIYYTVVGKRVLVSFIMDLRQDPDLILRRLQRGT